MFWTLFALLSLVVLGGFISYYGDLQGRRWGKKRVSWFGMRPKHTAILITSLTGAFISLLSIATLLAISPVLREVIWRGEKAIRDYKQANEQYLTARKALNETQQKLVEADQKNVVKQQELAANQAELAKQKERLLPLQQEVDNLKQRKASLQASLAKLERETDHLTLANNHLETQNYNLKKQNLGLHRDNEFLGQQNRSLGRNNVKISLQNDGLLAKQKVLTKENGVLSETNNVQLVANRVQLAANAAKLKAQDEELKKQQQELASVTEQLDRARQEMSLAQSELENSKGFFTVNYDQVRRGRIIVRAGGELARTVIDAHMGADVIKTQLRQLLDEAGKAALALGGAKGQNGRAVRIVSKRLITLSGDSYTGEEESLNALTENLVGSDRPVVVIIAAFNNTIEGEQVVVELQPNIVVPMFASGAVLASSRLNANLSDDQITQAIAQFLQTNVRAAAVKAGALAQVDPVSGVNELGQFDPIELGQLALRARQMRGSLMLRAVAKAAITSADPLDRSHLRVEVVRASDTLQDH